MKNWKVRNKIIGGFSCIIFLMLILSVVFMLLFIAINNRSLNLINFTSKEQQILLKANADILNMRRMTPMVHAFAGDEVRIDSFNEDFKKFFASTNNRLDEYLLLINKDPHLSTDDIKYINLKVNEMKKLLIDYKTLLFDPNIISAKQGNIEAIAASNSIHGSLILSVSAVMLPLFAAMASFFGNR